MRAGVGVGVVGLGFMGRTHAAAYQRAGARLVALCDAAFAGPAAGGGEGAGARGEAAGNLATAALGSGSLGGAGVLRTADLDAFLVCPGLEAVSVCTPTDTHEAITARVLAAGKHALVEKPVALSARAVRGLAQHAASAGRLCMPAMCMRFWPAWAWLRGAVASGRFGRVRAARFDRLGAPPAWSHAFYGDVRRSGGALFDLHVHDTDFVVHCFGVPAAVRSFGDVSHVTTAYRFAGGDPAHVVASGGWLGSPAFPFRMRYTVEFASAVADFDLARSPSLLVHHGDGRTESPDLSDEDGWQAEVAAFVDAVGRGSVEPPATLASAALATAVLEAEAESLRTGREAAVRG